MAAACIRRTLLCGVLLVAGCGARSTLEVEADTRDAGGDAGVPPRDGGTTCTPEACNGVDDDCDGRVDEDGPIHFPDADGDGFGASPGEARCPGAGFVTTPGDCDDTRADVSPSAAEVCSGGVDEDCDGVADCDDADCECAPDDPVEVDPTTFSMGSPPSEPSREADEVLHEVTITRAFAVMRTEVTQATWRDVMGNEPSYHRGCGDGCPVETVSHSESLAFANALSVREGRTPCYELGACSGTPGLGCPGGDPSSVLGCDVSYRCAGATFVGLDCDGWRLPTEAEWELAARGGSTAAWPIGDDVTRVNEIGWCGDAGGVTHPVAELRANPWGLYDTAGNVYEWVWDYRGDYPATPQTDPLGPTSGRARSIRGGSYAFGDYTCRSANRGARDGARAFAYIGLRLVRTLP